MEPKNPAAVALGKRSGINMTEKERKARAQNAVAARNAKLSSGRRKEIAKKAAATRWSKVKAKKRAPQKGPV